MSIAAPNRKFGHEQLARAEIYSTFVQMSRTVLLLDDDANFRASVTPSLEAHGLRVVVATKASSATELLEKERPVLAVVDGLLPDVNGIQWIEQTRESGHNLMIFFVSAFFRDLTTFKHLTQDLRVNKVFYKPIAVERFAKAVAEALAVTEGSGVLNLPLRPDFISPLNENVVELAPATRVSDLVFPDAPITGADLEKLRNDYTQALPMMTEELVQAVHRVREDHERISWIRDALRRSHDIHGTAGSYELDEISSAAAKIEEQIRGLQDLGQINWAEVDIAVETMEDEVARQPRSKSDRVPSKRSVASAPALSTGIHTVLNNPIANVLGPKLLVVEEDAAMVAYLRSAFDESLLQMLVANDPENAISIAVAECPSVVLLGAPLDESDEAEAFIQTLHAVPGCSKTQVIMLAMDGDTGACLRTVSVGADFLLSQPIDPRRLERVVDVAWKRSEQRSLRVHLLGASAVFTDLKNNGTHATNFDDLGELVQSIDQNQPHAVVVGSNFASFENIRAIRSACWQSEFALVVVGGMLPEEGIVAGADDVITHDENLMSRVQAHAQHMENIRADAADEEHGLMRRSATIAALDAGLAAALRQGRSYAVGFLKVIVDLDREDPQRVHASFKACIAQSFRREDIRGVWDDGMIAVGFDGANASTMSDVIARLNVELARLNPNHEGQHFVSGLASSPLDGDSVRSLAQVAYTRMANAE